MFVTKRYITEEELQATVQELRQPGWELDHRSKIPSTAGAAQPHPGQTRGIEPTTNNTT